MPTWLCLRLELASALGVCDIPASVPPSRLSRQGKEPLPFPAASLVDVPDGHGGLPLPLWVTAV